MDGAGNVEGKDGEAAVAPVDVVDLDDEEEGGDDEDAEAVVDRVEGEEMKEEVARVGFLEATSMNCDAIRPPALVFFSIIRTRLSL